jgi:hypothetical protein
MPTPGPNVIIGTDGANVIHGTAGNDVIYGMGGHSRNPNAGSITAVRVGTGFSGAVSASSAPGDPNHLYVLTKDNGEISILNPANGTSQPFLTIPGDQFSNGGERGVIGLAFDPNYAANGLFYVDLTEPNGDIQIRQYHYSGSGSPTFVHQVLSIPHSEFPNHNGGQLAFGRMETSLSGSATAAADTTRTTTARTPTFSSARSCASTPMAMIFPAIRTRTTRFPPTIPLPMAAARRRSGPMACAIPGGSASIR